MKAVIPLLLSACILLPRADAPPQAPFAEPTYQQLAPDRAATRPADVQVFDAFHREHLPEGVHYAHEQLELTEPHVTLGVVRLIHQRTQPPDDETQAQMFARIGRVHDEALARLRTEAARHGANAVYIESKDGNYGAQAMWLSSDKPSYPPADAVLAKAERPGGYTRERQVVLSLDAATPIKIAGQRHQCYTLVLALDRDAHLADHTRDGLFIRLDSVDKELAMTAFATPMFATQRSHTVDIGCPDTSGPLVVHLAAGSNREHRTELGTGHVVAQVWTRSISEAEVAAMVKRRAEGWARLHRQQCNQCYRTWVRCEHDDPRDCPEYLSCLSKIGETYQSCEAGP